MKYYHLFIAVSSAIWLWGKSSFLLQHRQAGRILNAYCLERSSPLSGRRSNEIRIDVFIIDGYSGFIKRYHIRMEVVWYGKEAARQDEFAEDPIPDEAGQRRKDREASNRKDPGSGAEADGASGEDPCPSLDPRGRLFPRDEGNGLYGSCRRPRE